MTTLKELEQQYIEAIPIDEYVRKFMMTSFMSSKPFQVLYTGDIKLCCPFHDEKTPSFSVSAGKGIARCFGSCAKTWNVVSLNLDYQRLILSENISRKDSLIMLYEVFGSVYNLDNPKEVLTNSKDGQFLGEESFKGVNLLSFNAEIAPNKMKRNTKLRIEKKLNAQDVSVSFSDKIKWLDRFLLRVSKNNHLS